MSLYAVWNRLEESDDDIKSNDSNFKSRQKTVKGKPEEPSKTRQVNHPPKKSDSNDSNFKSRQKTVKDEPEGPSKTRQASHPPKKRDSNANQNKRSKDLKKANSSQNLNRPSELENWQQCTSKQNSGNFPDRRNQRNLPGRAKSNQNLNHLGLSNDTRHATNKRDCDNFPNGNKKPGSNGYVHTNPETRGPASSSQQRSKRMSFLLIKKLTEKDRNEILLTISNKENGFIQLLKQDFKRDLMAYALILLGKAVSSDLSNIVAGLINSVNSCKDEFMINVQKFLASFQMFTSEEYHLDSLVSLTAFLVKFQNVSPSNACEVLPIMLPLLKQTCEKYLLDERASQVSVKIGEIEEQSTLFMESHNVKALKKLSFNERLQLEEPPENFRSIPVLPSVSDIQQFTAFLRPNITQGKYNNTEHYLDVQYRLLREDYVRPLREGIAEYLKLKKQNKSTKKCRDVRVYHDVQILKQEFVNGGLVHMAYFSDKGFERINWEFSKRFLTGALLCLSCDDFKTLHFATVARREPKELSKGLLILRFEELSDFVLTLNPLIHFVVIETTAYFEAYRYNLDALLQLNEDTLPLKNYIIETQKNVQKPQYLSQATTYDMRPLLLSLDSLVESNGVLQLPANIRKNAEKIPVLQDDLWPTHSELNLDPSQYTALKAAVTKEFAVIQGPPGTGKTYIGLRITQLLLHNISQWQSETRPSPILVICYTNHALDQFLEGILLFTQKIVRVGGRGKNESLANYQLSNLKRVIKSKREVPHYIFSNIRHKHYDLQRLKEDIDHVKKRVDVTATSILSESELIQHIGREHYRSLKDIGLLYKLKDDGRFIEDWLGTRGRPVDEYGNVLDFTERQNIPVRTAVQKNVPASAENLDAGGGEGDDGDSEGEADIEYIEAQRDINSEEFADVSYDIPNYTYYEDEVDIFTNGWQVQGGRKQLKKYIRHNLRYSEAMPENEARRIRDVWTLSIEDRWRLYKFWIQSFIKMVEQEVFILQERLRNEYRELCDMRTEEDIFVCKQALVVGMTTTGAAKYRHIVQSLNPRILIVEEAAEILESHIVTSLTRDTQHVILIGDHQQLRPNPTVHLLATKYGLNVSLFERMVQNGLDCYRLDIQHRMRPEIASLLVPHIYSNLRNHESVDNYENIKGVSKNVFFITHSYNEVQEKDSKSKVNEHEAKFLIQLCKYFILQGYKASQITVLTTYSGQLFELKRQSKKSFYQGVKFTVVDNFQGEENDIILISFVRSNDEGEIGFLKISNRVCVSLSRAKKGLYCIGNFELLAEKNDLWKNIIETLKKQNAIGSSLQLTCQNHPGVINSVQDASDFDSVPEGGCSRKCEFRLGCGHVCSLLCHPYDPKHEEIKCPKPCSKKCSYGHPCTKKCYKECAPCLVLVPKMMEECGHISQVRCDVQELETKCLSLCDRFLPCGHMCINRCSEPCVLQCMEKIRFKSPVCNHKVVIECSYFDNIQHLMRECKEPCRTELSCGHMCRGTCGRCRQGRLHIACKQPCKRILVCGHECKSPCSESCPPCQQPCENQCSHSKCPKTCGEPCEKCMEPCTWSCEHKKCNRVCGEPCDRTACDEPCQLLLKCEHPCIGVCGEPCPTECRICDEDKVKDIFFGSEDEDDARFICLEDCKHIFELEGIKQWMMHSNAESKREIQMKCCPKCKTVIRKNLRFGNIVKSCLEDIEKVKKITYGDKTHNTQKQKDLYKAVEFSPKLAELGLIFVVLLKFLDSKKSRSIQELITIENIVNVLTSLIDATKSIEEKRADVLRLQEVLEIPREFIRREADAGLLDTDVKNSVSKLKAYMTEIKKWLVLFVENEYFRASQQQLKEVSCEVHRLKLANKLLSIIREKGVKPDLKTHLNELLQLIMTYAPFQEAEQKNFTLQLQNFAQQLGTAVLNISDLEKQAILKAMALTKGHWYQCPNGHVYCITECGGATETSKCNECGAQIGGSSHRLLPTNRVATEMDGATLPAWPGGAMNMFFNLN
ncbi:NFX1-type zinc finger-containing protein 1 [Caerostris darwini]|uniref:NFX1-type zinc finger-containing protein 1 n=1 Tax=Caerostris darwini TaxID=1538125 RepID=A0AAV4UR49_9ARAC|nr:NFX1-type zinc finger-containing protein 1 [Caerostris darwini]